MALWYDEVHQDSSRFGLKIESVIFTGQSKFQKVEIVETASHGRALLLDGLWMVAEADEKTYHEMLVHPALTTAPSVARVLIIGGGDGGSAREVLTHPGVEEGVMVEIDELVIDACKAHLPSIGTAWDSDRLQVLCQDGAQYVRDQPDGSFDVVLIDGADPVGPAAALFGPDFLEQCARILKPTGVFAAQAGSPTLQREEHLGLVRALREVFPVAKPYYGTVSIYPGAAWSWAYASHGTSPKTIVHERAQRIEKHTDIYNRDIHIGSFAMPNDLKRLLDEDA